MGLNCWCPGGRRMEEPEMKGTWQTTGSTLSAAGAGVIVIAAALAAWVVPRLAWILGAMAAVLVLAAVLALVVVPRVARWSDRRDAEVYAAARPVEVATEPVKAIAPAQDPVTSPPQAIENHYHGPSIHFHGPSERDMAAVTRALSGHAGETRTEGR